MGLAIPLCKIRLENQLHYKECKTMAKVKRVKIPKVVNAKPGGKIRGNRFQKVGKRFGKHGYVTK